MSGGDGLEVGQRHADSVVEWCASAGFVVALGEVADIGDGSVFDEVAAWDGAALEGVDADEVALVVTGLFLGCADDVEGFVAARDGGFFQVVHRAALVEDNEVENCGLDIRGVVLRVHNQYV